MWTGGVFTLPSDTPTFETRLGGDQVSTGVKKRELRAEDPGGLVKNRENV